MVDGITEFSIMRTTVTSQRSTAVDFAGPIEYYHFEHFQLNNFKTSCSYSDISGIAKLGFT